MLLRYGARTLLIALFLLFALCAGLIVLVQGGWRLLSLIVRR